MTLPYAEVIGDPIIHSKSPLIHNRWLAANGIRAEYRATRVRVEALADYFSNRRADPMWLGSNITIPHKESALHHLDQCCEEAAIIGAVNCIVPESRGLVGHNTDVHGLATALDQLPLEGRAVAIIGAGGAARAAVSYLATRHVKEIIILVRNPDRARSLEALTTSGMLRIASFSEASRLLEGIALVINASPLGMTGFPPMPAVLLSGVAAQASALFDMVYDPVVTDFLSVGRSEKIDGLSMLIGQAARAFQPFFSTCPPANFDQLRADIAASATLK